MFTNNYIALEKGRFFYTVNSQAFVLCNGDTRGGSNDYASDIGYSFGTPRVQDPTTNTAYGVYFGSGDTPPTKEDYTLEAVITSGLSALGEAANATEIDTGDKKTTAEGIYMLKNISEEEITVREVGYFGKINTSAKPCLYERSLVEPPVTIPPGEARLITYRITIENL